MPPLPLRVHRRSPLALEPQEASALSELDAKAALRATLMLMLRNAGFSGAHESALELLADVTADRLTRLGNTLRTAADARARAGLAAAPGMLRASDDDVPPELVLDCVRRVGFSWRRLAATAAATAAADDEQAHVHKRQCLER